jgi:hypothetical protein
MNTKFIGVKDFRQNISDYAKRARNNNTRFIVMNRNKPLFEIKPFAEDEYLDSFVSSMIKAEADVAAGRVISHEALVKKLGLN